MAEYEVISAESLPVYTIEDCIKLALVNNPSLTEAEFNTKMEEASLALSKTNFLPELEVEAYYEELKDSPVNENQQSTTEYGRTKEAIKVTQSVYDGGEKYFALKTAEAEVKSAQYKVKKQELLLIYEVKKAYLDYSYYKSVLDVKKNKFDAGRNYYEVVDFEYNEGTISKLDLIDAKLFYGQSIMDLKSAVNDYKYAAAKLNVLMGRSFDAPIKITNIDESYSKRIYSANPDKALFDALLNRPEVFDTANQIEAYKMRLKKEKAGYHPDLDIEGEYNFTQHDDQYDTFEDWNVKFKVTMPIIFGQINTRNKVKRAEAALEMTKIQREKLKEVIALEVNRICSRLNASKMAVSLAEERLELGEDRFSIYEKEEELGELSRKDMTLSSMEYYEMKEDYLEALYGYYLDRIYLERVTASKNTQMLF